MDWVSVLTQNSETLAILLVGLAIFARQAMAAGGDRLQAAADVAAAKAEHEQNQVDMEKVQDKIQIEIQKTMLAVTERMEARSDKMTDIVLQQNTQLLAQSERINERNEEIAQLKRDRLNYRATMDNQEGRIAALEEEKVQLSQDYEERLAKLERDVAQWRSDYKELASKLKERDTEINELYDKLNATNSQLEKALAELDVERKARMEAERQRDALLAKQDEDNENLSGVGGRHVNDDSTMED